MAVTLLLCSACELKFKPNEEAEAAVLSVQRYDRLESRYLTTGDFSALQQMNTDYPIETRTLIEKMLQLGTITDANISNRFLMFYQDSTLQALIADAEAEYANMDDINQQLKESFERLNAWMPELQQPSFYAQIGALHTEKPETPERPSTRFSCRLHQCRKIHSDERSAVPVSESFRLCPGQDRTGKGHALCHAGHLRAQHPDSRTFSVSSE